MKSLLLTAAALGTFFALTHARALAIGEYCPARLTYSAVGPKADAFTPGTTFGLQLHAESARTLTAELAFDTDHGWYTATVTQDFTAADKHYSAPWVTFVRHEYESPKFYVQFPQITGIRNAFVYEADVAQGSPWAGKGTIACAPAVPPHRPPANARRAVTLDPQDVVDLSAPVPKKSLITQATPTNPLFTAQCEAPAAQATAKVVAPVQYPTDAQRGFAVSTVRILVGADGKVEDSDVYYPAGQRGFDDEALLAAQKTTYTPARAYCQNVPQYYLFVVTFDPSS